MASGSIATLCRLCFSRDSPSTERSRVAVVGARLLFHALAEIAKASTSVGFEIVVVHAIDDDAVTFYARFGFQRFVDHSLRLFMTTKDLRATLEI